MSSVPAILWIGAQTAGSSTTWLRSVIWSFSSQCDNTSASSLVSLIVTWLSLMPTPTAWPPPSTTRTYWPSTLTKHIGAPPLAIALDTPARGTGAIALTQYGVAHDVQQARTTPDTGCPRNCRAASGNHRRDVRHPTAALRHHAMQPVRASQLA